MQPNRLGRVLGISTRIAAEKLREKSAQLEQAAATPAAVSAKAAVAPGPSPPDRAPAPPKTSRKVSSGRSLEGGRRLGRGAGRFSAALVRPFAHATGVLGLQVVGVFFVLFALYFSSHVWHLYQVARWRDRHLLIYAGFALLFAWFAGSSFWRANHKQNRR